MSLIVALYAIKVIFNASSINRQLHNMTTVSRVQFHRLTVLVRLAQS